VMSRGYGAMLLKKSAAGLDYLKCNVSKFSEATLCQPVFPVCFGREHIFGDFGTHMELQGFAMC
jgi:hypothetical protein